MQPIEPHGTYRPNLVTTGLINLSRSTPLGRGALRKLMTKAVRRSSPTQQLDVPLFGGVARLHHTGNSSEAKALMNPKRYAREEFEYCRAHMPKHGGTFVDIGANAGIFSLFAASLMESGTLLAIEPQPDIFMRLQANFALNPEIRERLKIEIINSALGAEHGTLELSLPGGAGLASARGFEDAPSIEVPMAPLNELLIQYELSRIDILKIDVEGFEDEIIFPFFETATKEKWPSSIVMEYCNRHRWERDCEELLTRKGYLVAHKDKANIILSQQDS